MILSDNSHPVQVAARISQCSGNTIIQTVCNVFIPWCCPCWSRWQAPIDFNEAIKSPWCACNMEQLLLQHKCCQCHFFFCLLPGLRKLPLTPMQSSDSCAESWRRLEAKFTATAVCFLASLLSLKLLVPNPRKNRCSSATTLRWHKSFRRANSRARGAVGGSQGTELNSSKMADGIQCLLVQRESWGRK